MSSDLTSIELEPDIFPAPPDPADWPVWRDALHQWRAEARQRLNYDDSLYARPEFLWAQRNFSCCLLMLCDELFFRDGCYHVDEFLDQSEREFGGFDSIVFWHAYPRIGVDERNQFDFYREMPGGLAGLREVSRAFARRGVKVFLDYNPWDVGTRREDSDDLTALARLVEAIEADGIFLDTMQEGGAEMRQRFDAVRAGVILEGEIALPLERLHDHHNSWAQWFKDSPVPGILRNKWFERRHIQHGIHRWDGDHTQEIQTAWLNGSGVMVWENVFGAWNGWCARDRSLVRAILPIQRRFFQLFCGENWTPLTPTLHPSIYASLWQENDVRLWTLVNRSDETVSEVVLEAELAPGEQIYDLISGQIASDFQVTLPPRGVGAFVLVAREKLGHDWPDFLQKQAEIQARADFRTETPERDTFPTPASSCALRSGAWTLRDAEAADMKFVGGNEIEVRSQFTPRECGYYDSRPLVGHSGHFTRRVRFNSFALDTETVTNAQFHAFIEATGYRPQDSENYLRHWTNGVPPTTLVDEPVVYVSLEDARSYALWAKKRIPGEEEWQIGVESHALSHGEVWEWTESERSDGRTRFCLLKGGSKYQAHGSHWYTDGGPREPHFSLKFLLMAPTIDRCSTIGFRCAVSVEG